VVQRAIFMQRRNLYKRKGPLVLSRLILIKHAW
jgi:hypothetical protein